MDATPQGELRSLVTSDLPRRLHQSEILLTQFDDDNFVRYISLQPFI